MEIKDYDIPDDALLIFVGIPGSGKTTIAEKLTSDKESIISSDGIREELFGDASIQTNNKEVFEEFHKRIENRLQQGKLVIADATSLKSFARTNLYDLALKYKRPIRIALMNISLERIIMQNNSRERKVPEEKILTLFNLLKNEYENISNEIKQLPDAKICDVIIAKENEGEER